MRGLHRPAVRRHRFVQRSGGAIEYSDRLGFEFDNELLNGVLDALAVTRRNVDGAVVLAALIPHARIHARLASASHRNSPDLSARKFRRRVFAAIKRCREGVLCYQRSTDF